MWHRRGEGTVGVDVGIVGRHPYAAPAGHVRDHLREVIDACPAGGFARRTRSSEPLPKSATDAEARGVTLGGHSEAGFHTFRTASATDAA